MKTSDYTLMDIKHAFLAGLVEGDGCISTVAYKEARKKRGITFGVHLCVSNTRRGLVEFLTDNFEGRIDGWQPKGKGNFMYRWALYGEKAKTVLLQIYPYLVSKKKQAELAVKMQTLLTTTQKSGLGDTQKEHNEKMQIVEEMHILNAKGVARATENIDTEKGDEVL